MDNPKTLKGVAAHPAMVSLVREARGWNQGELAAAAGLSQGFLSKVESGVQDLRDAKLIDVATVLDCPPMLLINDAPIRGLEVTCLHHRKRSSRINAISKKQIEATSHLVRVSVEGLLADVDLYTDLPLPRPGEFGADGPAAIASTLREYWGVEAGPLPNLIELLERAGVLIHVRQLGTAAQDAVSSWPPSGKPVLLVNSGLSGDRQRFTIAHELGHLLMHTVPGEDQEREANQFAGEFLAPAADIADDLAGLTTSDFPKLIELKQKWGLSIAALIQRAKDIDAISDRQFREFHVRLNRLGWKRVEPGTLEREEPALLDKIVEAHLSVDGVTMGTLASMAQMTEPAFRRFFTRTQDVDQQRPRLKVSTARD